MRKKTSKNFSLAEIRALMRLDFMLFVERCFLELYPQTEFLPNWHIEVMAALLDLCRQGKRRRLIVNVPPRSLKSLIASIALPAWILGHNPSAQILCVSYAQDLADKLARDCLQIMQSNWYRALFPGTRLSRTRPAVADFTTTANGFRKATSVDGGLTGHGAEFIIIDDPLKPDEATSESQRTKVNNWFGNTLFSRQNNKLHGCIILVMQRLHEDDLVGHVLEQEPWEHMRFPAIAEEDEEYRIKTPYGPKRFVRKEGDALHPEREPLEVLEQIKKIIGAYNFAGQYQQTPAPLGGGLVKLEWFKRYVPEKIGKCSQIILSLDTANKADQLANFSACTIWGVKGKNIYLLNVYRDKLEFPDLVRAVEKLRREFGPTVILIEDAASGVQLGQYMLRQGVQCIKMVKPEGDKVMRMNAQSLVISNGFVHIPEEAPWLQAYLHELTTFPRSKNSDQVDSTSQALAWVQMAGQEPGLLTFIREENIRTRGGEAPTIRMQAPEHFDGDIVQTIAERSVQLQSQIGVFNQIESISLTQEGWREI